MKAMLLAAGAGTRMRPLTNRRAKPTLPILDQPMLAGLVEMLASQGIREVVVNAHAYPDQLRAALASVAIPVRYSIESELLGSGGGIRAARSWLEDSGTFLVLNGDMRVDLDVEALLTAHRESGALATLALRDDPRKADFGTIGFCSNEGSSDPGLRVCRITELVDQGGEQGSGLFIGVHAMEPEIFERMPQLEEFESLRDVYVPLLEADAVVGAWLHPPNAEWTPLGTPGELLEANLAALASDRVWIGAGAEISRSAQVGPRAVIGAGSRVPDGAVVRDAVLLPGARPPAGARLERAIAHDTEVWRDD